MSIKQSLFPDQCKIKKPQPLIKKYSKNYPRNYRPNTHNTHIIFYKNDLLYKYQSDFCPNFSTDSCLVQLIDSTLKEMDKGYHSGMIQDDLQKALDTLDHTVLLQNGSYWF